MRRAAVSAKVSSASRSVWSNVGSGLMARCAAPRSISKTPMASPTRAATRITSAIWPSVTKPATPFSVQASPAGDATTLTDPRSQPPRGPVSAAVAIREPSAMPGSSRVFAASSPSAWISPAASTPEEISGPHSSAAPVSSVTRSSSTGPAPTPPYASSTISPTTPISASAAQSAGSYPASVSIVRRTSASVHLSASSRCSESVSAVRSSAVMAATNPPVASPSTAATPLRKEVEPAARRAQG